MNRSGNASQPISLPKGGGALHGIGEKFSPDLQTGTGNSKHFRRIADDHLLNCPSSDLREVLDGRRSFQDALKSPTIEPKRMTASSA